MKKVIKVPGVVQAVIIATNLLANPLVVNAQTNGQAQEVSTTQTGSVIAITRNGAHLSAQLLIDNNGVKQRVTLGFSEIYSGDIPEYLANYIYQGMSITFDSSKVNLYNGTNYISLDTILALDGESILVLTSRFTRSRNVFSSAAQQAQRGGR